ncbi:Histidine ammonia-lyase [Candidatus Rhabdochlamydia oedothoracis]|uniref:Histidine ammonia-lyase n=1 Tax=Candidatus Rhabdochlamydia oedothoracis TaxID=2720720 RepID=A0ABX8V2F5_9BACT|nr:Tyrosine ammonia-lyase [Candidatus Rhabdochlamydia sp. W815]QYF49036.1 Histidine ammonia-lyase [Candidatus Rhabdochlamydia oedothoracis]
MTTSLAAKNRSLCNPVSIQSLTSTGDFQDIVSLGLIAGRIAQEISENSCYVLAFELLCGVQAAEIRGANLLSSATREVFNNLSCSYVMVHLRKEFPTLISYSRFVYFVKNIFIPLFAYLLHNKGKITGISFIDSKKIQVCHNKRIRRNKVFTRFAKMGKQEQDGSWELNFI